MDKFSFGSIVVDGKKHHRDLLFFPDGTIQERKRGVWIFGNRSITKSEIEVLCKSQPEVIIVGLGTSCRARLSPEAESYAREAKVELTSLPSTEAVKKLKQLTDQGKKVAAIIHIT